MMNKPFLIEIRLKGKSKQIIKKLIYDIFYKFHIKGQVKHRVVPHVTLFGSFNCKSIKSVIRCIHEVGSEYSRLEYEIDGFDYFELKKNFFLLQLLQEKTQYF